jgi:hypothetical protein
MPAISIAGSSLPAPQARFVSFTSYVCKARYLACFGNPEGTEGTHGRTNEAKIIHAGNRRSRAKLPGH